MKQFSFSSTLPPPEMTLSLDTPLSVYSIVAAYVIAAYPHRNMYQLINKTVGFNNVKPRDIGPETLLKRGMKPEQVDQVEKLAGAHRNGNEVFPLWGIAVVVANQAEIAHRTLNIASIVFIVSRLTYNYIYTRQKTEGVAGLRSLVFVFSIAVPLYLITISANKLRG